MFGARHRCATGRRAAAALAPIGLALLAAAVALIPGSPAAAQELLDVPEVEQENVLWCWAAVSQAIIDYYHHERVEQCVIADWARATGGWGPGDCCAYPGDEECSRVNNLCSGPESVRGILGNWQLDSECVHGVMSWASVETEIYAGRPFVMRLRTFGGHFVVGRGYQDPEDGGLVHYMNPWMGRGFESALYNWLVDENNDDRWDNSLRLTTDPWYLDPVALAGDEAPNGVRIEEVSGRVYGLVKGFDANAAAEVVFAARLEGGAEAILTSAGESIALTGEEAPGGGRFAAFYLTGEQRYVAINAAGEVAFQARLEDGRQGVFTRDAVIALEGEAAPDGGVYQGWFEGVDINDAGTVAFMALSEVEGEPEKGIYTADALVTREGLVRGIPALRQDGVVVYLAGLTNQAIVSSEGEVYASGGGAAPGGGTFATGPAQFNYPEVNGAREVTFSANLESGEEGVFTNLRRIAVTGEAAPGGGTFVELSGSPTIDDTGRVVFAARTSEGRSAIFDSAGQVVAESGQIAFPGAWVVGAADPVLTNGDQVVFWARLRDEAGEVREGLLVTRGPRE